MKLAIFGGAGFAGTQLVQRSLNRGFHITVFDNLYKGGHGLLTFVENPNFKFEYADIRNEDDCKKIFQHDFDFLILLVGIVGLPECDKYPKLAYEVNVVGWRNLMNVKPRGLPVIAASTGSCYGHIDGICTEESPTEPLSHYGKTKLQGEKIVLEYENSVALRFATAAGISPNPRWNLLPNDLTLQAHEHGKLNIFEADNMRTFIDIRDFADSFIFMCENFDHLKHRVYNVGDERNNWSKRRLAEYISSKIGCKLTFHETGKDTDARNYIVSYSRINELNFRCQYTIEETVDNLIKAVKLL